MVQNGQNDGNFIKFCDFQNAFGREICVRDAFRSILCEEVENYVNLDPNFLGRAVDFLFSVNLEGFFTMVGEIPVFRARKNGRKNAAQECKSWSFSPFFEKMKVDLRFKAKR